MDDLQRNIIYQLDIFLKCPNVLTIFPIYPIIFQTEALVE